MQTAIQLQHVTRRFGDLIAVDDLSLSVSRGEIFGLLGPNGAGKTTVINLVNGLLRRHTGTIEVLGFDPQRQPRQVRQSIGLVPQETNVYGDLSAYDNLLHHAALYCSDLDDIKSRIERQLRLMDLWDRCRDSVHTYSGGMKRRLALARSLLHEPQIIFFDEPTLGVDVQVRHVLWQHIQQQRDQGRTFIVSTNDMHEADTLCDRLVIIDHGRQIALDTPENLKSELGRDVVTVKTTPVLHDPAALFAGLDANAFSHTEPGVLRFEVEGAETKVGELVSRITRAHQLETIRVARPSLDDVFLHYTGRALRE